MPEAPSPLLRHRLLRLGGRALGALGLGGLFVTALVGGALLHLDTPSGRRVFRSAVSRLSSQALTGDFAVGEVVEVGLQRVVLKDVEVTDPFGNVVLRVASLTATADVARLALDALFGSGSLNLKIDRVRLDGVDVFLVEPPVGTAPTLADTFLPTPTPSRGTASAGAERPSRELRLWMPDIQIGSVWARGPVAGLAPLEGSLRNVKGAVLVGPKGVIVDVQRFGLVARGLGGVDARGTGTVRVNVPGSIWTTFDGWMGEVPVGALVEVKADGGLVVTADVSQAKPGAVKALLPAWPLLVESSAHVKLESAPRGYALVGTTTLTDSGTAKITGALSFEQGFQADLDVDLTQVDLRAIVPSAPATRLNATSAVSVYPRAGRPVVDINGTIQPSVIAAQPVPLIDFNGSVDERGFVGKAKLHEPGMPVGVAIHAQPSGALALTATIKPFELSGAPRIAKLLRARGSLAARVDATLEDGRLTAKGTASVSRLDVRGVQVARAELYGTTSGPLATPSRLQLATTASAEGVVASGWPLGKLRVRAQGPVAQPRVKVALETVTGPHVAVEGTVSIAGDPTISDLRLAVSHDATELHAKLRTLKLGRRGLDLQGLQLSGGAGELRADAHLGARTHLDIDAKALDLDRLSRALGLPGAALGGALDLEARFTSGGAEPETGRIALELKQGSVQGFRGIDLSWLSTLHGTTLQGRLTASHADYGDGELTYAGRLAGSALELRSWRALVGKLHGSLGRIPLQPLGPLLFSEAKAADGSPLQGALAKAADLAARARAVGGTLGVAFAVERQRAALFPDVSVSVRTDGLRLTPPAAERPPEQPPYSLEGHDLMVYGSLQGETGNVELSARVYGVEDELSHAPCRVGESLRCKEEAYLTAAASLQVEPWALLRAPREALPRLSATPLQLRFTAPKKDISRFAWLLPTPVPVTGAYELTGTLQGTLLAPVVGVRLVGTDVLLPDLTTRRAGVDLRATYSRPEERYGVSLAVSDRARVIVTLGSDGQLRWSELQRALTGQLPQLTGSTTLAFKRAPLDLLVGAADTSLLGSLDGSVRMDHAGAAPRFNGYLTVKDLSLHGSSLGGLNVSLDSKGALLVPRVRLIHPDGDASLEAAVNLEWEGLSPKLSRATPLDVIIKTDSFEAGALQPLLERYFTKLGGRLTTQLRVRLTPVEDDPGVPIWVPSLNGTASMSGGSVQISALGLQLDDLHFNVDSRSSARSSTLTFSNVGARARADAENFRGAGFLSFDQNGLALGRFDFFGTKVPLMLQGVSLGEATGNGTLSIRKEQSPTGGDRYVFPLRIPALTVQLPLSSSRNVIDTRTNPDIAVSPGRGSEGSTEPKSGPPWAVEIELGEQVRISRSDIEIPLSGRMTALVGDSTQVSGAIDLTPGGRLPLVGKLFIIEQGRVLFDTGETTNPHVNLLASWRSKSGTIYVEVKGTVRRPELRLFSEQNLTEPQIISLLLGGSGDASAQDVGSTPGAASMAGVGAVALGFNELFAGTPILSDIELRTSSTSDAQGGEKANYTAAVRISEDVWFEGTYTRGTRTSTGPGAQADGFSGTVDWRFHRNWSLRTEGGNQGAALDLLWQYRY